MTALHANGIHVALIEKLDRLARDLMAQEAAIAELAKHRFTLVSVCEPELISDDTWRKSFRQMMGVFSELDKNLFPGRHINWNALGEPDVFGRAILLAFGHCC